MRGVSVVGGADTMQRGYRYIDTGFDGGVGMHTHMRRATGRVAMEDRIVIRWVGGMGVVIVDEWSCRLNGHYVCACPAHALTSRTLRGS